MSFRVVRDSDGNVIAFGPDDGSFEPSQSYSVEEEAPQVPVKNTIREQISALYAAAGVDEKSAWLIDSGMASMVALAATQGVGEHDLYALNPGYKQVKDLSEQIKALRSQL